MGPREYQEHVTVGHQLLVNLGGPVRSGWLEGSRRHEGTLATGGLCIQSDGDANAPLWRDSITFANAAIPPSMVEAALLDRAPAPAATFAKRHCVRDALAHAFVRSLGAELASPTEPLYAEALSRAFVLHLLGAHGQTRGRKQIAPSGKLGAAQLRNVVEMIHEDLASNLSLQRMATCSGYSVFQFARLFKATTGARAGYKSSPQDEHLGALLVKRCVGSRDGAHRARGLHGRGRSSRVDVESAARARDLGAGALRCSSGRTR